MYDRKNIILSFGLDEDQKNVINQTIPAAKNPSPKKKCPVT